MKRTATTKDIALLYQLHKDGQLNLAPEFQRNGVWPGPAKAYLVDSILNDRPLPIFFLQRKTDPQTGRTVFDVIDGQQRLRAVFDFLDDRFRLTQSSKKKSFFNKKFSGLSANDKQQIRGYDVTVQELVGYSEKDIRDIFVRMNKYVLKLSPQELRHAKERGEFHKFVEELGGWSFWVDHKVIGQAQHRRMRSMEYAAELSILLIEGPQDKKESIDLYYQKFSKNFIFARRTRARLKHYLGWIEKALPSLRETRYRSPVDLYSLIGALDLLGGNHSSLARFDPRRATNELLGFANDLALEEPPLLAARYLVAASRQTDNFIPRQTRIEILHGLLRRAYGLKAE